MNLVKQSQGLPHEALHVATKSALDRKLAGATIGYNVAVANCRFSCDVTEYRRNHVQKFKIAFPSEVLVSSDYRLYRNLAFYNVLARQGSSFCNRACLNFQAFALRD